MLVNQLYLLFTVAHYVGNTNIKGFVKYEAYGNVSQLLLEMPVLVKMAKYLQKVHSFQCELQDNGQSDFCKNCIFGFSGKFHIRNNPQTFLA